MNDRYIVTIYVVIDDILKAYGYADDCRATGTAAEILTVGVIAAKYFRNHHEWSLCVLTRLGYVHGLSVSRFNRRLHALRDWLYGIISVVTAIYTQGEAFIIDSMPLPVCKRARASHGKKVRRKAFCGYCATKKEKFFGWRLHLICISDGVPVSFDLLPASEQDLTPNSWADEYDLRLYRKRIETVYTQMEAMGIQHLHARTNHGFDLKAHATLLALALTNIISD
ncbi:MAG TPA: hypothetical protein PLD47_07300 [Aggregatilineales bacterium]|nr:hypothetical protein [Anaerolineales bacterium]HRE47515.1 hypothetical protein [Aggregatilineales bacterium]